MTEPRPSFFRRFFLAFAVFWRMLVNPDFAAAVLRLHRGEPPLAPATEAGAEVAAPVRLVEAPPDAALQLLGLLQQEGRLLDFLQEDVAGYSDAEVGAAARVVHEGCRKVLHEHVELVPVCEEQEGARVTLESGFDAAAVRLAGNVVGHPPFTGTLVHRGWRVAAVKLPKLVDGHDVRVLAPAEVEL